MAQKIIICEASIGSDLLQSQPLAGLVADGYEVTQVSGFSARDNKLMCVVLLSEPATQTDDNNAEQQNGNEGGSDNDNAEQQNGNEGGSGNDNEGSGETEP